MNAGLTSSHARTDCILHPRRSRAGDVFQACGATMHRLRIALMSKPMVWLGIGFWGVELIACTIVLEHVPLSIAFPLMALSYVAIVLAGAWVLKEPVNCRHALGALLITAGAACVGATGI